MSTRTVDPYGSIETQERSWGTNAIKLVVMSNEVGVAEFIVGCVGVLQRIVIKPGSDDDQPDDEFDVTITGEHGLELYADALVPNDSVTVAFPSSVTPKLVYGNCTFAFANMGDSKTCEMQCYFSPRSN